MSYYVEFISTGGFPLLGGKRRHRTSRFETFEMACCRAMAGIDAYNGHPRQHELRLRIVSSDLPAEIHLSEMSEQFVRYVNSGRCAVDWSAYHESYVESADGEAPSDPV